MSERMPVKARKFIKNYTRNKDWITSLDIAHTETHLLCLETLAAIPASPGHLL